MVYVGVIIGAGFASGREIHQFFSRFGSVGLWGAGLCGLLLFAAGAVIFLAVAREDAVTLEAYFTPRIGSFAAKAVDLTALCFMFSVYCVMVAGFGALLEQSFGFPPIAGSAAIAAICFWVFVKGKRALVGLNSAVTPVMILGMLLLNILALCEPGEVFAARGASGAAFSALLYVGYNTIETFSIFAPLKSYIPDRKTALWAAFCGAAILELLLFPAALALTLFPRAAVYELPLLYIADRVSPHAHQIYFVVLFLAMLTTAAANGLAVLSCRAVKKAPPSAGAAGLSLMALPLSRMGFSEMVAKIYPFFGYAGIVLVVLFILFQKEKAGAPRRRPRSDNSPRRERF